jgi:F-type H+-transporting ATPase subunit delta
MTASVAGRYASALFELATTNKALGDVERDLTGLGQLLAESEDLRRLVRSPVFSSAEQGNAISVVAARAGMAPLTINFLKLLAKNRRLFAVDDMIKAFLALAARHRGEVAADVTSAYPLSDAQKSALEDTLRGTIGGRKVQINTRVDSSLLGGLIVKMGSRMIDSSLRTKLDSLKIAMKEVR